MIPPHRPAKPRPEIPPPPPVKSRPEQPGGPYLIVGLARSGQAAARMLAARGERVIACDAGRPVGVEGLEALGVEVHTDTDGLNLLDSAKTLVKSPGVPAEAPVIATARERRTEVLGELELAWRLVPGPVIAVTGTNGKTTTTEMIGHIYRTAGRGVEVAGNIGAPLSDLAAGPAHRSGADAGDSASEPVDRSMEGTGTGAGATVTNAVPTSAPTVVCECSSFQLEDSTLFAPECAAFLNFSPDHLDRHLTAERYLEAKTQVFRRQHADDIAVLNGDDPAMPADLASRIVRFCGSGDPTECGLTRIAGTVFAEGRPLFDVTDLQVLGAHNAANAMAAAAAALSMGVDREAVAGGLAGFEGVAHRLEPIAEREGILFVNDSKATNAEAAITALQSFAVPVRVILGGSEKGEEFSALARPVTERCPAAYLIGESADRIERALRGVGPSGRREHAVREARPESPLEINRCEDLEEAVVAAARDASPGEVVLLSPGCASFDQFRDYEERGERFRQIVEALT